MNKKVFAILSLIVIGTVSMTMGILSFDNLSKEVESSPTKEVVLPLFSLTPVAEGNFIPPQGAIIKGLDERFDEIVPTWNKGLIVYSNLTMYGKPCIKMTAWVNDPQIPSTWQVSGKIFTLPDSYRRHVVSSIESMAVISGNLIITVKPTYGDIVFFYLGQMFLGMIPFTIGSVWGIRLCRRKK